MRKVVKLLCGNLGGALYLELAVPELLDDFIDSAFAAEAGAKVSMRSPDGERCNYHDTGGVHRMMGPPPEFFSDLIAPHFAGNRPADGDQQRQDGTANTPGA